VSRRRGTAEANGRNANPARGYENTHRTHELHHRPGRRRSGEEIGKATRVAPGRTVGGLAATDESNALAGVECTNGLTGYRSRPGTEEEAKRRVRGTPPAVERGPSRRSGSSRGGVTAFGPLWKASHGSLQYLPPCPLRRLGGSFRKSQRDTPLRCVVHTFAPRWEAAPLAGLKAAERKACESPASKHFEPP
jgi:hypothetical protein